MRQLWAHWPRLAERPPQASLVRHWPDHDTHSAPCTNTSSSAAVSRRSRSISLSESSRGRTMRLAPRPSANRMPSALEMVIWVLAWISRAGQMARASSATAGSCTMSASTPAAATSRRMASTAASSVSNTSTLRVR
jgi:hypothetical protein